MRAGWSGGKPASQGCAGARFFLAFLRALVRVPCLTAGLRACGKQRGCTTFLWKDCKRNFWRKVFALQEISTSSESPPEKIDQEKLTPPKFFDRTDGKQDGNSIRMNASTAIRGCPYGQGREGRAVLLALYTRVRPGEGTRPCGRALPLTRSGAARRGTPWARGLGTRSPHRHHRRVRWIFPAYRSSGRSPWIGVFH